MARTRKHDEERFNELVAEESNLDIEASAQGFSSERVGRIPERPRTTDKADTSVLSTKAIFLSWDPSKNRIRRPKTHDPKLQAQISRLLKSALKSEARVLADMASRVRADRLVVAFQGLPKTPEALDGELRKLILQIKSGQLQPEAMAEAGGKTFGFTLTAFWCKVGVLPITPRRPRSAEHRDQPSSFSEALAHVRGHPRLEPPTVVHSQSELDAHLNRVDHEARIAVWRVLEDATVSVHLADVAEFLKRIAVPPPDVSGLKRSLHELQVHYQQHIQTMLDAIAGKSFGALAANQAAARKLQLTLHRLNLRIRCPECGKPALLRCRASGNVKSGIFQLEHNMEGRQTYHAGSSTLPDRLMVIVYSPPRRPKQPRGVPRRKE